MESILREYKQAVDAVRKAGEEVLALYAGDVAVEQKADGSPVTAADNASHNILVGGLSAYGYLILSEEAADESHRLSADRVWIIDPLDGTMDFTQKTDEFSIMVGLVEDNAPIFGVVLQPAADKLYIAAKGKGAFLVEGGNVIPLRASSIDDHAQIRAVVSRNHLKPEVEQFIQLLGAENMVQAGSNGVKVGLIADGKADLFCNATSKMGEWDGCAPHIILEEAGGTMTGVDGSPLIYNKETPNLPRGILATNGNVHAGAVAAYKRVLGGK